MSDYIYRAIEYIILSLYLFFVFLSIQIWFLWKDIDKENLKFELLVSQSFFRKNSVFVFSFSTFILLHEFEFIKEIYAGIFDMMALVSIVLFTYSWYSTLKRYANRKILPHELISLKVIVMN